MASKLQREIHNQLDTTSPSKLSNCIDEKPSKDLILRKLDLLPVLPDVLVHCKPHALHIVNLDVSFSIADFHILNLLCNDLTHLQVIHAKSCGLCDTHNLVSWPKKLHALDLSRNELKECPQGVSELLYLAKLNLSGNSIEFMPPGILAIPSLVKCLLLNNPIRNIPKDICRGGVGRMRSFLMVEPHSLPPRETIYRSDSRRTLTASPVATRAAASNCNDLRRHVLRNQGSFESGYESNHRRTSSSTNSSDIEWSESSDIEADLDAKVAWPAFHSNEIPEGYIEMEGRSQLCQVYLPNDCRERVEIHEVKDMSLHPRLEDNELLITPVVRITPHGLKFGSKPAIIILSHCTQNNQSQMMDLVPMCSNTREYQTPEWTNLETPPTCEIFEDCIMFTTFHFSLFAIAASYPYPSSSLEVWPGVGGDMLIPELPGFHLHVSDHSVKPINAQVSIKGTAYYCDKSYRASDQLALASACIGVEPHGTEFNSPVQISVPIPDYTAIKLQFPDAKLELWCSERILSDHADTPRIWKCVDDADILIERSEDIDHELESEIAIFTTDHFSWYEFLWTVYASSLQRVGLGAASLYAQLTSRARYVAVRFQAFMSPPYGTGNSFGLVVTVYKFGDPLSTPSNYPLLVADSGIKRLHLRTGNLHVRIEGCFLASKDIGEVLERNGRILDFTGEDFCERFEFALSLKVGVSLPLPEGQVLGKLRFIQWEDSNPIHKSYNLIMVGQSF